MSSYTYSAIHICSILRLIHVDTLFLLNILYILCCFPFELSVMSISLWLNFYQLFFPSWTLKWNPGSNYRKIFLRLLRYLDKMLKVFQFTLPSAYSKWSTFIAKSTTKKLTKNEIWNFPVFNVLFIKFHFFLFFKHDSSPTASTLHSSAWTLERIYQLRIQDSWTQISI